MSTKTTFKRVALVTVAALGFGVLTSVAPASAAVANSGVEYVTSITASAAGSAAAGNAGASVVTTVRFRTSTTGQTQTQPAVMLISAPSTSLLGTKSAYNTTLAKAQWKFTTPSAAAEAAALLTTATSDIDGTGTSYNLAADGTKLTFETTELHTWYDVAGTYKWAFWDDVDGSGTINGSEFSYVYTQVAIDATSALTATATAHKSTAPVSSTYGALVKINIKDAAGNAASTDAAGGIKVTASGSAKIEGASSYIIPSSAFNGSGNAWINVKNTVAEVSSVTVSGVGSTTVNAAAVSITFVAAAVGTATQVTAGSSATTAKISAIASNAATIPVSGTITLQTGAALAATPANDYVDVIDTFGIITGKAGATFSQAVAQGTTGDTYSGVFTVAYAGTTNGQYFDVSVNGLTPVRFTTASQTSTGGSVNVLIAASSTYTAAASLTTAKLSATTVTLRTRDQFSGAFAAKSISASLSSTSRNYGQVLANVVTGAAGTTTFTLTDANTAAGTSLTDVVTFSDGTNSATLTITYAEDATFGISTRLITSNDTDSLGVAKPVITPVAISTGDGAEAGSSSVSVTLKNAAGTLISGIPVTWSVTGTGCAMKLPSGMTTYSVAGVASASVYAWITGTCTVSASAGGTAVTVPVTFASTTKESARVVSATVNGSTITAKVVDRFGNPVSSVDLSAKTTGGYFGSGSTTATGTTGTTGTVDFVLLGGSGDVTVSASKTAYAQTIALKDSSTTDAADVYTATVGATATAAATGIGATFAPAGVNSVTVNVTGADTTAQAATDAAAEATDAANAATDAANAAAEAADAATAAAQDAADAVAALSAQVSTMMASLKAQLTALTNLVIKIQKKVKA